MRAATQGDIPAIALIYAHHVLHAVIGGAKPASVALHRSRGFVYAGRLHQVGFKFGKRLDTVYMQRALDG